MSEMKVKVLDDTLESKSVQEVEQELLEKHEQELQAAELGSENTPNSEVENTTEAAEEQAVEQSEQESIAQEFTEKDVLSYIKDRYNREINSVEELFEARAEAEELPEDVSAFLKYKKETGRGIQDFMSLNKDYDSMDANQVLADYYSATEDDLDREDIDYLLNEKFAYDEDVDDEKDIKQKQIAKKRELAKAKKYFNELKETYKVPLESSGGLVSEDEKNDYEAYKKYIQESKSINEETLKRSEYFQKKTDEVFSNDFKGFDFNVGEKKFRFKVNNVENVKTVQSDINNFVKKFLNENNEMSDAAGYHKSLFTAMNPDAIANHFYEQGKADAIKENMAKAKNIDMDPRGTHEQVKASNGWTIKSVSGGASSSKLKIRTKR